MEPIRNKKAFFDFEILEEFEAGLELLGHEVKSIKKGGIKLDGSYVGVRRGEAFLIGAHIHPYQPHNTKDTFDQNRSIKLLLTKPEIRTLKDIESKKGSTIVPLSIFQKGKNLKIKIAIARGKKKYDKRESIKKRDSDRDIQREMKS